MSNPYIFGSAPSSSRFYTLSGGGSAPPQKKKHHGVLDVLGKATGVEFVSHLDKDVGDMALGLPAGLVHMAKHPVASLEEMGKATWHDWSPLFLGLKEASTGHLDKATHDFGKFGHQFYAHPLAPILDIASVVTLGAGSVARGAKVLADAGHVGETSKLGRLAAYSRGDAVMKFRHSNPKGEGIRGQTLTKPLSANPVTRKVQEAIHNKLNDIGVAAHTPSWWGQIASHDARYDRLMVRQFSSRSAALEMSMRQFVNAANKLDDPKVQSKILEHMHDQLHYFSFEHDLRKTGGKLPRDLLVLGPKHPSLYKMNPGTDFEAVLRGFASRRTGPGKAVFVTGSRQQYIRSARRLAHARGGNSNIIRVVPRQLPHLYGLEGAYSAGTLRTIYRKSGAAWKYALLGLSPRYFVNNAVGNFFMYAMNAGGVKTMRGLADALAQGRGPRAVVKDLKEASTSGRLNRHWQDKYFSDNLNNTIGQAEGYRTRGEKGRTKDLFYKFSLFPVTHFVTDQFIRRAALNNELRKAPGVTQEMRRLQKTINPTTGRRYSRIAAFDKAADSILSKDRQLRDNISHRVMDTMGDYWSLNKHERAAVDLIPFYTWNRHSVRFAKQQVRDNTLRSDVLGRQGQEHVDDIKGVLGEIPSWMKGYIPFGTDKDGRVKVFSTAGVNPFATVVDTGKFGSALVSGQVKPGEGLGGQLNPFLAKTIEHITGQSLLTGARIPTGGGLLPDVLKRTISDLPQSKILDNILNGTPQPKNPTQPFMFKKDLDQNLLAWLGIPAKHADRAAIRKLADKEAHRKHPRRRKKEVYTFG